MGEIFSDAPKHEAAEDVPSIDALPGHLGFFETERLGDIRARLLEAMISYDIEAVKTLIADYYQEGELSVNKRQGDGYGTAQIGLLLAVALVRRDAGRTEDYENDLDDALDYAANMGYDEVVMVLRKARTDTDKQG